MCRTLILLGGCVAALTPAVAETVGLPVPAVVVRSGEAIVDGMLGERRMVVNEVAARNFATSREQVVGLVARRSLAAGQPIALSALRQPWLFKEGERVLIEFSAPGLSMKVTGIALNPGVVGEVVGVRNPDTGLTVKGVVRSDGTVGVEGSR